MLGANSTDCRKCVRAYRAQNAAGAVIAAVVPSSIATRNDSDSRWTDKTKQCAAKKPKRHFISKSRAKHLDGSGSGSNRNIEHWTHHLLVDFVGNCRTLLCSILFVLCGDELKGTYRVNTHTHSPDMRDGYIIQLNYLFTFSVTAIQLIIDLFSFRMTINCPCVGP